MSGWFAMRRGIHEHPLFHKQPERLFVWSWMISTAAWKDTRQDAGGHMVTVKRGQLLTSYRQMSNATGVGIQVIRTLIGRLQTEHAIDTDTNTAGRLLITIENYDKYQTSNAPTNTAQNTPATQQQHTKEQGNQLRDTLEANASNDAEASQPVPVSLVTSTLWTIGVRYFVSIGISEKQARSFIGMCRSKASDVEVLAAIEAAHKCATQDPIPYITAALQGRPQKNGNQSSLHEGFRKAAERVMAERADRDASQPLLRSETRRLADGSGGG